MYHSKALRLTESDGAAEMVGEFEGDDEGCCWVYECMSVSRSHFSNNSELRRLTASVGAAEIEG
jgi:hypothetical protein